MTTEPWLTGQLPELVNQSRALEILRDRLGRPLMDPMTLFRWWNEEKDALARGEPPKRGFPPPHHLVTAGEKAGHPVWDARDLEVFCVEFMGRAETDGRATG
jgi:hypothetical protein